jgi:hypothetical protein
VAYSVFVFEAPDGASSNCYLCAQGDCASHPFLTLAPDAGKYSCADCGHATPASFVRDSETDGHWQPDEDPVEATTNG